MGSGGSSRPLGFSVLFAVYPGHKIISSSGDWAYRYLPAMCVAWVAGMALKDDKLQLFMVGAL